jgi:TolB protein
VDRAPDISPDGSRIAYVSEQNGRYGLWVMNSDGTNAVQLPYVGNAGAPAWSPDSTRIAFGGDEPDWWEIWVIDADGSNPRRLTTHAEPAGTPNWSPDGQRIIYQISTVSWRELYTVNPDGTEQQPFLAATSPSHHDPVWSPDGTQLATLRYVVGSSGPHELWLMDADGTNGRLLVAPITSWMLNNIAWSADSNWLVFAKDGQIWRVRRDGEGLAMVEVGAGWEPSTNGRTFSYAD